MEHLYHTDIKERREAIVDAFDRLLASQMFAGRPNALQWRFFRACLDRLFSSGGFQVFDALPQTQLAQLKFEVEERLKRYYQRPGMAADFVFALAHRSRAAALGLGDNYPHVGGYCLLVREYSGGTSASGREFSKELEEYLEKFLVEAMQAEFMAYASLPEVRPENLAPYFCTDSPAMREILNVLQGNNRRGWVLSNPLNPSTHRVMQVLAGGQAFSEMAAPCRTRGRDYGPLLPGWPRLHGVQQQSRPAPGEPPARPPRHPDHRPLHHGTSSGAASPGAGLFVCRSVMMMQGRLWSAATRLFSVLA